MRRTLVGATVILLASISGVAVAAHYCTAATGTFISVPLPVNPVAPERTHLYMHDRYSDYCRIHECTYPNPVPELFPEDSEGTWLYLENGLKGGYNTGGVAFVPILNATGSADTPCGAVLSEDGLSATPKAGADDVVL